MRLRCTSETHPSYHHYGGRGISVCPQWLDDYDQFVADMGECPPNLSLDRIDTDKDYSPNNCRWATMTEQLNNQRRNRRIAYNGETRTASEWAKSLGIRPDTLFKRLGRMPADRALRAAAIRPVAEHGGKQLYERGCRCGLCREAHNARHREGRARRKANKLAAAGTTSRATQN
jgi:hypothetical protein